MVANDVGPEAPIQPDESPPAYTEKADEQQLPPGPELTADDLDSLNEIMRHLYLPSQVDEIGVNVCLAHLKLLSAFQMLKENIGYTDGLFGLWDSRVLATVDAEDEKFDLTKALSRIREKRWALYVARAVDRYETWWNAEPLRLLTQRDMSDSPQVYGSFPTAIYNEVHPEHSVTRDLPPVDVLMVWHAHMLNPRAYLEDCIRFGKRNLWSVGMPWKAVNESISTDFIYLANEETRDAWKLLTGRAWSNLDDSMTKILKCPACHEVHEIPWTTCGLPEDAPAVDSTLVGEGYGDGKFGQTCGGCGVFLNSEYLEVARFVRDYEALRTRDLPMPGTILNLKTGYPESPVENNDRNNHRKFPNRLLTGYVHLQAALEKLIKADKSSSPTMENVRALISEAVSRDSVISMVDGVHTIHLPGLKRLYTRVMVSRYWGNYSPFALDLGGAVHRQGIFTEKMHKIDWLHSPDVARTMKRFIKKYRRFIDLMGSNRDQVCVPTLDVDLVWHTHQLTPRAYYKYSKSRVSVFVDHDDKIGDDKLSTAFEWTSNAYQRAHGEFYSECTCWYCLAIRSAFAAKPSGPLGVFKHDRIGFFFQQHIQDESGHPETYPHISAHNSVREQPFEIGEVMMQVQAAERRASLARLVDNYHKACDRARRKGIILPPRDEYYYNYWGRPFVMYGPYQYPYYWTPGYYPGTSSTPGTVVVGKGGYGACIAASCGSQSALPPSPSRAGVRASWSGASSTAKASSHTRSTSITSSSYASSTWVPTITMAMEPVEVRAAAAAVEVVEITIIPAVAEAEVIIAAAAEVTLAEAAAADAVVHVVVVDAAGAAVDVEAAVNAEKEF